MSKLNTHTWMDKPILHPDHAHQLESDAAINEFGRKMNKDQAEDEAYKSYKSKHRKEALYHHYNGMKAASGAGDSEAARKHHAMYTLHAKALGLDPSSPPPDKGTTEKHPSVYKFKVHKADMFALSEPKEDK